MGTTLVVFVVCVIALRIYSGPDRDPKTFTIDIPEGTNVLIAAGENPLDIPATWSFRSGDVLVLDNHDRVPQQLGAWTVAPGERRAITLRTFDGVLVCSLHPAGELVLDVTPRPSDLGLAVKATLLFGPALGVMFVGIARVARALGSDAGRDQDGAVPAAMLAASGPPEPPDDEDVAPRSVARPPVRILPSRRVMLGVGAAVLALTVVFVVTRPWEGSHEMRLFGFVETPARQVGTRSLPELPSGRPFSFVAPRGGLLLVFFGYANCPDVCPLTMKNLGWIVDKLPEAQQNDVEVAMATVDPGRDQANAFVDWVRAQVPSGHALRTDDPSLLESVVGDFGAGYNLSAPAADGSYEVVHSSFVYGIDDTGSIVVSWPYGIDRRSILSDVKALLRTA